MTAARRLLQRIGEGVDPSTPFYHGTMARFDSFDTAFAGKGHDQNGPGFYFTSSMDDARVYSGEGGVILEVRLHLRAVVPLVGRVNRAAIERMIKRAPDLEDTLTDWDENPQKAFRVAVDNMIRYTEGPKDAFEQVWYDFYRNEPAAWMNGMVEMGFDGVVIQSSQANTHVVVFNPGSIEIVKVLEQ